MRTGDYWVTSVVVHKAYTLIHGPIGLFDATIASVCATKATQHPIDISH